MKNSIKYIIFVALTGFCLTTFFTFPLILNLKTNYYNSIDFHLNAWTYWYSAHSILDGTFLNTDKFFTMPILHPFPNTGAQLDFMAIPSLILYLPAIVFFKNHIFAVNFTTFSLYVLNFVSSFLCLKKVSKKTFASLIGALIFTYSPGVINLTTGHTEYLGRFLIPPFIIFLFEYLKVPNFKLFYILLLIYTLSWFTSIEISIFLTIIGLFSFAVSEIYSKFNLSKQFLQEIYSDIHIFKKPIFFIFILISALVYFFHPYVIFSNREHFTRTLNETSFFSAEPLDFLIPNATNKIFGIFAKNIEQIRHIDDKPLNYAEYTLFPGYAVIILFFIFCYTEIINNKILKAGNLIINKSWVLSLLCLIFSIILSFGPYLDTYSIHIKLPYYYLYKIFPLLAAIRTPTRILYIWLFFISYIITYGIANFNDKLTKNMANIFNLIIGILVICEYINYVPTETNIAKSINFDFKNKVVLFLPINRESGYDSKYLIQQTYNNFISINGTTGSEHQIEGYTNLTNELDKGHFTDKWLKILEALNVTYIAIDKSVAIEDPIINSNMSKFETENKDSIVLDDVGWKIVDLTKIKKTGIPICDKVLTSDINLQFNAYYARKAKLLYLHYKIENPYECIIPFVYDNRYVKITYKTKNSILNHSVYMNMPPYLLNQSETEGNIELSKNSNGNFNEIEIWVNNLLAKNKYPVYVSPDIE